MMKTLKNCLRADTERFRVPRTAQDVVPVSRIWPDGIFRTGGRYSKTWSFTDINYLAAGREDKESMFLTWSELLNGLESGVSAKITVRNRRGRRSDLGESVLMEPRGDGLDGYREEYNRALLESAGNGDGIVQSRYLTVTAAKRSVDLGLGGVRAFDEIQHIGDAAPHVGGCHRGSLGGRKSGGLLGTQLLDAFGEALLLAGVLLNGVDACLIGLLNPAELQLLDADQMIVILAGLRDQTRGERENADLHAVLQLGNHGAVRLGDGERMGNRTLTMGVFVTLHGRTGERSIDERGAAAVAADEALEHPVDLLIVAGIGVGLRPAGEPELRGVPDLTRDEGLEAAVDKDRVFVLVLMHIVELAALRPADLPDIDRVPQDVPHPAIRRGAAAAGGDAGVRELPGDRDKTLAGEEVRIDLTHGVGVLIRDVGLALHVIAEGRDSDDLTAADLLGHAALDLTGEADGIEFIHPFDDALDQGAEGGIVQRLGDGDDLDAKAGQHGFIDDALLLVPRESGKLPDEDHGEGLLLFFGQRDHILEGGALSGIAAGDAILHEDILPRHVHIVGGCVLPNQLELGVEGVFVLALGRDADIGRGGFHGITSFQMKKQY